MLRKAYNWLLLVLPAGWVVGFAFVVWLLLEGLVAFYDWQFGLPGVREHFLKVRDGFAIAACALLGLYRVAGLHPLFDEAYRDWLSLTPWRRGLPLPVGPVRLAPQDGVIMAAMLLALHDAQLPRLAAPAAFLFAYLGALLVSFVSVGFRRVSYALAFALGAVVWLRLTSAPGLGLLALLGLVSQFVLSRSLDDFPWVGRTSLHQMKDPQQQLLLQALSVGWPFSLLQPNDPPGGIRSRDGFWLSVLVGWWAFALCSMCDNPNGRQFIERFILLYCPLSIAMFRLFVYLPNHRSPISLMGRLFTLRWIIPSYDRAFASPLCIVLTAVFAPAAIDDLSAWLGAALPTPHLVLALSLMEALILGPTLRDWRLTSRCRLSRGLLNAKEFVEL